LAATGVGETKPRNSKNNAFIGIFHCFRLGGVADPWPNATMKSSGTAAKDTKNEKEKEMTKTTNTTTTTPTDASRPFATVNEIRRELVNGIVTAKQRYNAARAKFLAAANGDLANAVAKLAKDAIALQVEHKVWLQVEREMAEHGPVVALANALDECQAGVQDFFDRHSSRQIGNAVEHTKAEAFKRLAEQLVILKRFLRC